MTGIFQRTNHVGITVPSLQEALQFWVGVLGYKVLFERVHVTDEAFLEGILGIKRARIFIAMVEGVDGQRVELLEYETPEGREHLRPRPCDIGSVHLAIDVRSIAEVTEKAAALGWRVPGTPQTIQGGIVDGWRVVYMYSPAGFALEIFEAPAAV